MKRLLTLALAIAALFVVPAGAQIRTIGGGASAPTSLTALINGSAAAPTLMWANGTSGFYATATNEIGVSIAGTLRWAWNSSTFFPSADDTYDLGTSAQRLQDVYAYTLNMPNKSAAAPALLFGAGGGAAGIYAFGKDTLGIATGGSHSLDISGGAAVKLRGGAGNMTIQAGTGASRSLLLQITDAGSTARTCLSISAAQLFLANTGCAGVIKAAAGTAATPAYNFGVGDENDGLYVVDATIDTTGLASNGVAFAKGLADTLIIWSKAKAPSLTAASGTPNTVCMNATTKQLLENAATSCVVSAARFKRNIVDLQYPVAARIASQLKPKAYSYRDGGRQAIGLIAEQADSVDRRLATRNSKGEINSVNYEQVTIVLLAVVQEQQRRFAALCKAGIKEAC